MVFDMQNSNAIKNCTLKFRCPLKWEVLQLTNEAGVRYCGECCKSVYYCQTKVELDKALSEGKCVALKIELEEPDFDDELMGF